MQEVLSFLEGQHDAWKAMLRQMVELESPSDNPAAVTRMAEWVADRVSPYASVKFFPGGKFGKHLRCQLKLKGAQKDHRILAVGHCDTVWPVGTLRDMPFREQDGRLYGPGIFDMKGGVSYFLMAVEAIRELGIRPWASVSLLLVSDEEVGSLSSRPYTEAEARGASLALLLEPAMGKEGSLKTARKGTGIYRLKVTGKAAHSGIDFAAGASAVSEMARQVLAIGQLTQLDKGITVNPGVLRGGSKGNVVAAEAELLGDIRFWKTRDGQAIVRKLQRLKPHDPRCRIEVEAALNRPALERTAAVRKAFQHARRIGLELGLDLREASTGGASDGNFIGALGVPVLDGLGAVGDGAHAIDEHIIAAAMPQRAALLAGLLTRAPGA
ncbi:MAG: M20 family metallopeptidase [Bryobacterales bacterium]|jgi:glutamate carboxypeptidase|nr:M20 family metallopeptidase [Bryobacterales bacterium]